MHARCQQLLVTRKQGHLDDLHEMPHHLQGDVVRHGPDLPEQAFTNVSIVFFAQPTQVNGFLF